MIGDQYIVKKKIVGMEATAEVGEVLCSAEFGGHAVLMNEAGKAIIDEASNGCLLSCARQTE